MESQDRKKMIRKFLKDMKKYSFPKSGPDFSVVRDWGEFGVAGNFAVVKHTDEGSVLMHQDADGNIKAFLSVGITQSVQSILSSIPEPLPLYIKTAVIPFKGMILCQGTIVPGSASPELESAAIAFANGFEDGIEVLTTLGD